MEEHSKLGAKLRAEVSRGTKPLRTRVPWTPAGTRQRPASSHALPPPSSGPAAGYLWLRPALQLCLAGVRGLTEVEESESVTALIREQHISACSRTILADAYCYDSLPLKESPGQMIYTGCVGRSASPYRRQLQLGRWRLCVALTSPFSLPASAPLRGRAPGSGASGCGPAPPPPSPGAGRPGSDCAERPGCGGSAPAPGPG